MSARADAWPELPLEAWSDTHATLHMLLQIVGKVRLAQSPWINHSWHTTLYVTARGLTTSAISYADRTFQIDFDFIDHELQIATSDGGRTAFALAPQPVSAFYAQLMNDLASLGLNVKIHGSPNEVAEAIPFDQDQAHRSYDREYVNRYWRALLQSQRVFTAFRARFIGKCSPVHLFWGAPDLAVTRFSGRTAPSHPGGVPNTPDAVIREAYSHEVSSCGFWAGGGAIPYAVYYSYAYPEPPGFAEARIKPAEGYYSQDLREFVLPYDAVRLSSSPTDTLLQFLQTTYEAAADLARWDRRILERN